MKNRIDHLFFLHINHHHHIFTQKHISILYNISDQPKSHLFSCISYTEQRLHCICIYVSIQSNYLTNIQYIFKITKERGYSWTNCNLSCKKWRETSKMAQKIIPFCYNSIKTYLTLTSNPILSRHSFNPSSLFMICPIIQISSAFTPKRIIRPIRSSNIISCLSL